MHAARMMALALAAVAIPGCNDGGTTVTSATDQAGIAAADIPSPPPPIFAEPLTARHAFTDDIAVQVRVQPDGRPTEVVNLQDASNIAMIRFTVQPGVRFPWHSHPGLVMVTVTQGELVFVYGDDCVERPYPTGTAFVDPGFGNVHYAFNPTGGETVIVAAFLGVPPTGPLTINAAPDEAAALDAKCGVAAAMAHAH